jgi:hypothetical protein
MPNPNYSEFRLLANYGEDPYTAGVSDSQGTRIYPAISDDSDEIDHKWVYAAELGGTYIELAHYASVKQVTLQNMSAFNGVSFYVDGTTGALIPDFLLPGEHISFCDPDVATGIMLYSIAVAEPTDWLIAICGRKD